MHETPWYQSFFAADYQRIYTPFLSAERTAAEVVDMIELLGLPPGSKILDLCCGQGRHTLPLAHHGYSMTGLDLSESLLQQAQNAAESQKLSIRWLLSDMRTIPFENEFDAVINIFTSFGYLENDNEDLKVLQQVQHALKPGGLFLLETVHQPRVLRTFSPHGIIRYSDGLIVLEERQLNLRTSRNDIRMTLLFPDGERNEQHHSMRLYTLTELITMLEQANMHVTSYYGSLNGSPLTLDSRLALLSHKAI